VVIVGDTGDVTGVGTLSAATLNLTNALGTAYGGTGLTSFTSGGVVYASSSSALATGSALTYDGSYFATASGTGAFFTDIMQVGGTPTKANSNGIGLEFRGGTTPSIYAYNRTTASYLPNLFDALSYQFLVSGSEKLTLNSTSLYTGSGINVGIGTSSPSRKLTVAGTTSALMDFSATSFTRYTVGSDSNGFIVFDEAASAYRLVINSSGNVGIGTSSPAYRVHAVGASGTEEIARFSSAGTDIDAQISVAPTGVGYGRFNSSANMLTLAVAGSSKVYVNSSGNLGLGVTPSAWLSTIRASQTGAASSIWASTSTGNTAFASNEYVDSAGTPKRIIADYATRYQQYNGQHLWYNAVSSTAGSTISFTQAMTLDASANLTIGATDTAGSKLSFGKQFLSNNGYANAIRLYDNGEASSSQSSNSYGFGFINGGQLSYTAGTGGSHAFFTANTERARIPAAGGFQSKTTISVGDAAPSTSGAGITFPATQSASSNANTLDDYDEYTAASAACSGAITTAVIWKLTKVGNLVTLTLPATTGTATAVAYFQFGTDLPSKYRPVANLVFPCTIRDNGVDIDATGIIYVYTSGAMLVYRDATNRNFTNAGVAGLGGARAIAISWTI
jgi:hypothetical protein